MDVFINQILNPAGDAGWTMRIDKGCEPKGSAVDHYQIWKALDAIRSMMEMPAFALA